MKFGTVEYFKEEISKAKYLTHDELILKYTNTLLFADHIADSEKIEILKNMYKAHGEMKVIQ